ncbi:hypothetical protein GSI_03310 [Ganoderma sinense ZZ0214-1]|uniref:Uncharacterized protein n=1 Tax=Ganoderma sinense ZZ0214-1 TaxID=1077348 RepID=A0A2G8SL92_9APHY|nr:hypothetical protein GSI_03310 [Ganoderma sinense ZZ0214-1]
MFICKGCNGSFTNSGWSNHLSQTRDPRCIAVRDEEEAMERALLLGLAPAASGSTVCGHDGAQSRGTLDPEDVDMDLPDLPDCDLDSPPILFAGDYFGAYTSDDDLYHVDGSVSRPGSPSEDSEFDVEEEDGWEPPAEVSRAASLLVGDAIPTAQHDRPPTPPPISDDPAHSPDSPDVRADIEAETTTKTYVVPYGKSALAGAPIPGATAEQAGHVRYGQELQSEDPRRPIYWPFTSKLDWEVARWGKKRGPGSTALTELLEIDGVAEKLGLSFTNSRGLNKIIDKRMSSGRPPFERHEIVVAGEAFEVYYRDVLSCIRALFGDPEFTADLLLAPERHFTDEEQEVRVYFEMNTGQWWWRVQEALDRQREGATVIPVIIASDKTQLTLIGNKTAYPVYLTIGNLPKRIRSKPSRHGQILLAYLPTSKLEHITNKAARRRTLANLFHACLRRVLAPLKSAGWMVFSSREATLLATGCKNGECPKCPVPRAELGAATDTSRPLRDLAQVLDALSALDEGPRAYTQACREAGIKPIYHPFWEELPFANIFLAITPDLLHQLYQGVIKHLIAWLKEAYGTTEIDARCRRLPENHSLRHFSKGISKLSRVTGKEHQDICRILLGLIVGLPPHNGVSPVRIERATRALLDFLYYAAYPTHTSGTLKLLDNALKRFHANKSVFVDLGIREHFKLPKLHFLDHYRRSIEMFGTTDNYDTQHSERLHIDFAKEAFRATNGKDELSQMTLWMERKEKIERHETYINWCIRREEQREAAIPSSSAPLLPVNVTTQRPPGRPRQDRAQDDHKPPLEMTRHPSVRGVPVHELPDKYGATFFRDALKRFVVEHNSSGSLSRAQVESAAAGIYFPFAKVPVWHRIKFWISDPYDLTRHILPSSDTAHAHPERKGKYDTTVPGRFDTVLVNDGTGGVTGVQGYRVAQVRVVFRIPSGALPALFTNSARPYPRFLAYVEWFTPFPSVPGSSHGLYKIKRSVRNGSRFRTHCTSRMDGG